jgi:hypothetical protein
VVTETVTGAADDFYVNRIERRIEAGGILYVTLGALEYCQDIGDWMVLDVGQLDVKKLGV